MVSPPGSRFRALGKQKSKATLSPIAKRTRKSIAASFASVSPLDGLRMNSDDETRTVRESSSSRLSNVSRTPSISQFKSESSLSISDRFEKSPEFLELRMEVADGENAPASSESSFRTATDEPKTDPLNMSNSCASSYIFDMPDSDYEDLINEETSEKDDVGDVGENEFNFELKHTSTQIIAETPIDKPVNFGNLNVSQDVHNSLHASPNSKCEVREADSSFEDDDNADFLGDIEVASSDLDDNDSLIQMFNSKQPKVISFEEAMKLIDPSFKV